jgi:transcriptional regulator with XRE-family HTH domain
MSRPRVNPEEAAREAFKREVKVQRVYHDMKQSELADEVGVVPSVMSNLLANPDKISAGRLRKIIRTLSIDPVIILAFLGYTTKEIQSISKST